MQKYFLLLLTAVLLSAMQVFGQKNFAARADSLLQAQPSFSGVILVYQQGRVKYLKSSGWANREKKKVLKTYHQFVLGSVSKQITAVLVLQQSEQGNLRLQDPIGKFLPDLQQAWKDSVTVHHLLCHTSGITDLNKPLAFRPGSQFAYSGVLGYQLLGRIIEKASGQSYNVLARALFLRCRMSHTTTPALYQNGRLAEGYSKEEGKLKPNHLKLADLQNFVAGAGIISTAKDLARWNEALHQGKLLSAKSYALMTGKQAVREHPVWGKMDYGYGLQIDKVGGMPELGHGGAFEGFNCINFYYPALQSSVIVLSNVDEYTDGDIRQTFFVHTQVRKFFLESL